MKIAVLSTSLGVVLLAAAATYVLPTVKENSHQGIVYARLQ